MWFFFKVKIEFGNEELIDIGGRDEFEGLRFSSFSII